MPIQGSCTPPFTSHAYEKLSQTGCVKPESNRNSTRGHPLRSETARFGRQRGQDRGWFIPSARRFTSKTASRRRRVRGPSDNASVLPVGTVMVKNFLFDQKSWRRDSFVSLRRATWVGRLQWNQGANRATLVPDQRVTVMFDTGTRHRFLGPIRTARIACTVTRRRRFDVGLGDRPVEPGRQWRQSSRSNRRHGSLRNAAGETLTSPSGHALCDTGQIAGPPYHRNARRAGRSLSPSNWVFVPAAGRVRDHDSATTGHAGSQRLQPSFLTRGCRGSVR